MHATERSYVIVAIMVAAGLLGGALNFCFAPKDREEVKLAWLRSLLGGVVASFMVPLFLNMISSTLIDQIEGTDTSAPDLSKLFVFAGFCLIAAVSSKAFITSVSERILTEARQTKKEVKQIKKEVEPLIAKETESESRESGEAQSWELPAIAKNDTEMRKVLNALANGDFALRTRSGVSRDTGIPKEEVNSILQNLAKFGLAKSATVLSNGERKIRWYITPRGRSVLD